MENSLKEEQISQSIFFFLNHSFKKCIEVKEAWNEMISKENMSMNDILDGF